MSRMVGVGSGGAGAGREDLPTQLLGWWLQTKLRVETWWWERRHR